MQVKTQASLAMALVVLGAALSVAAVAEWADATYVWWQGSACVCILAGLYWSNRLANQVRATAQAEEENRCPGCGEIHPPHASIHELKAMLSEILPDDVELGEPVLMVRHEQADPEEFDRLASALMDGEESMSDEDMQKFLAMGRSPEEPTRH